MPSGIPKSGKRVCRTQERRALRPAIIDPHQLYDVTECAAARGRSVASVWNDIRDERLKSTKVGKRRLILGAEIVRANLRDAGEPIEVVE